ncbi:MAG: hypothetical protein IBX50_02855 [Marinospirillum sp.]|uniref:hypothetical protein n=1 Tax=Marinospirillum sp. TaxID=2183934 RepID=UPI0019F66E35|nr:hypothetical protein [Marinospirillum sp.]MBE0505643.1 hypothetical protein [Marinospirillum sp.]
MHLRPSEVFDIRTIIPFLSALSHSNIDSFDPSPALGSLLAVHLQLWLGWQMLMLPS